MAGNNTGKKGFARNIIWLFSVVAFIVAICNLNGIKNVNDALDYFRNASDTINDCGANHLEWDCGNPLGNDSTNSSNSSGSSDSNFGSNNNSNNSSTSGNSKDNVESYKNKLNTISIADANKVDYKRSEWKHWVGSPCDTRETVLINSGQNVKKDDSSCKVISGTWVDVYSGNTVDNPKSLDIDHVIPLSYAAQHGGQEWSAQQKQDYANDTTQLLAVSAKENRSKSDKGPADYMPPNDDYKCEYSKKWIDTASKYKLSITDDDKKALEKGLGKCDG